MKELGERHVLGILDPPTASLKLRVEHFHSRGESRVLVVEREDSA
jgi:hypothetical protein